MIAADLETLLNSRLTEFGDKLTLVQAENRRLTADVTRLRKDAPQRPGKLGTKDFDRHIAELEFHRSTSSLSLAEEKKIVKDIALQQAKKSKEEAYNRFKAQEATLVGEIDKTKAKMKLIRDSINEIKDALLKVELSKRIFSLTAETIPPNEIYSANDTISPDHAAHVLDSLEKIQGEHSVVIDTVRSGRGRGRRLSTLLKVSGKEASVEAALGAIRAITSATVMSIKLDDSTRRLLYQNGENLRCGFEAEYSVTISVRGNRAVIRGAEEDVNRAKTAILESTCESFSFDVPRSVLGSIIGKVC